MKKIIITIYLIFNLTYCFSQITQYDWPAGVNYQNTYVSPDFKLLKEGLDKANERYEQNKKYINSLKDWILEIKTKANEKQLNDALDLYYNKLELLKKQDLSIAGDKIREIEEGIKIEIINYNRRGEESAKDVPKRLWESGNENLKKGNYSDAIQKFTELIKLDPNFIFVFKNRGIAYFYQKKYLYAITDFDKFIEKKEDDPFAYSYRGWAKSYQKDYMGAIADFNKQIEIEPTSYEAYYNRGSVKSSLGDENGAINDYTKSIELKPFFSMGYNNRGWAKFKLKKYSEALKDLNKAIDLDALNWVAFDSRQETKFALNDFKGCIEDCNAALLLNSNIPNSYFFRGRAYYKQGNKKQACEDWSKSGELGKSEAYEYISKYCNN